MYDFLLSALSCLCVYACTHLLFQTLWTWELLLIWRCTYHRTTLCHFILLVWLCSAKCEFKCDYDYANLVSLGNINKKLFTHQSLDVYLINYHLISFLHRPRCELEQFRMWKRVRRFATVFLPRMWTDVSAVLRHTLTVTRSRIWVTVGN